MDHQNVKEKERIKRLRKRVGRRSGLSTTRVLSCCHVSLRPEILKL